MNRLVIGILAHVDAGKTTLSEALLYKCDIIRRLGRVDKKDAFLDNYAMERERGITIFSKQACFSYGDVSFTLIDTPGHVDFSTEMERALSVLDAAILVISGTDGVQAHTRTLWKLLKLYDIPTIIFVNKMDREGTDREVLQAELTAQLSAECVDFVWDETGDGEKYTAESSRRHLQLSEDTCERIALEDEEMMERYLDTGEMPAGDVQTLIGERRLFPCIYGSALKLEGIDELLECVSKYAPGYDSQEEASAKSDNSSADGTGFGKSMLSARVYKITRADDGTRLTHMKVTGGVLKTRDVISYSTKSTASSFTKAGLDGTAVGNRGRVSNVASGAIGDSAGLSAYNSEEYQDKNTEISEKVTQLRIYNGEKYETVECAYPGMVVAVVGLSATYAGQAIGEEDELPSPEIVPVMTYRVITADRSHLMQLVPKLKALEEEDPSLNVLWNPDVRELQIQVMGDIQLEIIKRSLMDRFGEDVGFDRGSVLYKETITAPSLGVGHFEPLRHYAEAQLLLEPGERGSGITCDSIVSVNDLDLNWQRLIFTHIFEREHKGVLTGAALTDVHFTLVAGRSHIKHTEGGDFRQATYRAVRQGLMRAREEGCCILLEPYYELTIELPRSCCGRAMTDIEKKSGRVTSQYEVGTDDMVGLTGVAPVATMQGYVKEVSAYTKGLGSVYCTFLGYLPCHNQKEVVEALGYDPDSDVRNPSSSVFCAHGAGFIVEWRDVDSYKHLDWDPVTGKVRGEEGELDQTRAINYVSHVTDRPWMGVDEVDAIINRTAYGNRKENTYKNPFRKKRAAKYAAGSQNANARNGGFEAKTPGEVYQKKSSTGNTTYVSKEKYLLVDGYNIIFGWPELSELAAKNVDGARERLNDILCNYQAVRGDNLIVVYDAYRVAGHPTEYFRHHNIGVVYTKEAETADRYIERFAHENAKQYDITVATSDGLEQIIIRGAGCKLLTARDLAEDIARISDNLRDRLNAETKAGVGTRLGDRLDNIGRIT